MNSEIIAKDITMLWIVYGKDREKEMEEMFEIIMTDNLPPN